MVKIVQLADNKNSYAALPAKFFWLIVAVHTNINFARGLQI